VRERAYSITDADVEALRAAGFVDDAIFEQTAAAAVAEGLRRLDDARRRLRARFALEPHRRQHRADDPLGEARVELAAVEVFLPR
jgi:hypothetical protein